IRGELYIGGVQVARGYLHRDTLTGERFIKDKFTRKDDATLYRTGDLCRWLPDGNIEFLGRLDEQVKIRGNRVELGEVESILAQHASVNQCVVVAKEDATGSKQLVGYTVPAENFSRKDVFEYLRKKLPDYMVPSVLVELQMLPLTNNGKVDKRRLPDPDPSVLLKAQYAPPGNATEQAIAEVWQKLLGLPRIGIHDNFFELGGHSLLATRVVSAVRRKLQAELAIRDLFLHPTISALAACIQEKEKDLLLPSIAPATRPDRIPLSFAQERLWFLDQLGGSIEYHLPMSLNLKGEIDAEALELALRTIVNRHEVLRTVLRQHQGSPYQYVLNKDEFQLTVINGSMYKSKEGDLRNRIARLVAKPFDLSTDHMLRAHLISLEPAEHVLVITLHHIASDGWSMPVLMNELQELYTAYVHKREPKLPELPVQYADYALWQRRHLDGDRLQNMIAYWRDKLTGLRPLKLPSDRISPLVRSIRGGVVHFNIDKELAAELQALSNTQSATLYMTLLAAFKVLLYRYSGQHDVCIGTPIAGRRHQELEGLIGFFINTLALRSNLEGDPTFIQFLQQVRATTLDAYEHQDAPFEKVVEAVVKERDLSSNTLFQVMFTLQNTPGVQQFDMGGTSQARVMHETGTVQFDLSMTISQNDAGLQVSLEYCSDLFEKETIFRMSGHYANLLRSIVQAPQTQVSRMDILSKAEREQILIAFNNTAVEYPRHKTILHLFEEQAKKTPGAIAVAYTGISSCPTLTYKQLNERSAQLARYLKKKGVRQEHMVAMCLERGTEVAVALLGILKAGAAYVPIDPSYPKERIAYMLKDINASVVITSSTCMDRLSAMENLIPVLIDSHWPLISKEPARNTRVTSTPSQLAYVIYTSGTTGRPKGVMIEHGSLFNASLAWRKDYKFDVDVPVVMSVASIAFDVFTGDVCKALLNGGTLVLMPDDMRLDIPYAYEQLQAHGVNIIDCTPAFAMGLVTWLHSHSLDFSFMKTLVVGADVFKLSDYRLIKELYGDSLRLVNSYGVTEATVYSSLFDGNVQKRSAVPIGKPMDNTQYYILDEYHQPVPIGIPGQLFIGGTGVARGYLNQSALSAEKFRCILINGKEARLYATGDAARWLPDGNVEFIGRTDNQLKVSGYRIEPGEVEQALAETGMVKKAVVVAKEKDGVKRLIGYVVPQPHYNKDLVVAQLKASLPAYMIPAVLVKLESMPLTSNGKIDRSNLPEPDMEGLLKAQYEAPRNDTEEVIAEIWKDLLNVSRVGIHDNFFELGGHSLLSIRVVSAIRDRLQAELPIKEVFLNPTIAQLAATLAGRKEHATHNINA
ncbi:MAG TPA: amino acid adenylation domain-containing protein, partial [Chitinophagaceae bacterium]|nr:amino acid adenylation domain-containing protein [Chitinophagaceae bacterium]